MTDKGPCESAARIQIIFYTAVHHAEILVTWASPGELHAHGCTLLHGCISRTLSVCLEILVVEQSKLIRGGQRRVRKSTDRRWIVGLRAPKAKLQRPPPDCSTFSHSRRGVKLWFSLNESCPRRARLGLGTYFVFDFDDVVQVPAFPGHLCAVPRYL